jgi:uncharacterized protein YbaP (TraB family)
MVKFKPEFLDDLSPTQALGLFLEERDTEVRGPTTTGMDEGLWAEARRLDKKIYALETDEELKPTYQILASNRKLVTIAEFKKIFESDPYEKYKEHVADYYKAAAMYRTAAFSEFEKFFIQNTDKENYKIMIKDRNELWIPRIENLFNMGKSFVVVGAGHMVGDASLIKLLRDKGYTVEEDTSCAVWG